MEQLYRTGKQYADLAKDKKYDKLKYSDADCQAFCEIVLRDLGVRDAAGKPYNWKGSNDMARNAVSWIGTKDEAIKQFGSIPVGSWAFIWEKKQGKKKSADIMTGRGTTPILVYMSGIIRSGTLPDTKDLTDSMSGTV